MPVPMFASAFLFVLLASFALLTGSAGAERLMVDPAAPAWMHIGAAALLYTHIGGGAVGMVSGTTAILSPKGRTVHRPRAASSLSRCSPVIWLEPAWRPSWKPASGRISWPE